MKFSFIILLIFIITFPLAGAQESDGPEPWAGADGLAKDKISEISPGYQPWFEPVWEPPSGEIESFLFSLQAAIGALIIGYIIGYQRGRRQENI